MTTTTMRVKAAPPAGLLSAMLSSGAWRIYPLALLYVMGRPCWLSNSISIHGLSCNLGSRQSMTASGTDHACSRGPLHVAQHATACTPFAAAVMHLPLATGLSMTMNILPGIMADYAASRRAGQHMRCEDYAPNGQPPACRDAFSDVVNWSSTTSCISAVMLFILVRTADELSLVPKGCNKAAPTPRPVPTVMHTGASHRRLQRCMGPPPLLAGNHNARLRPGTGFAAAPADWTATVAVLPCPDRGGLCAPPHHRTGLPGQPAATHPQVSVQEHRECASMHAHGF